MPASTPWLLCRARTNLCALPIAHVIEIMRPLPVVALAQAPECVLGMCVVRGVAVPVVDVARCICAQPGEPTRFVTVRAGQRCLALAVDAVTGTIELSADRLSEVPALLSRASPAVQAVAALDTALLLLLQSGRVLPEFDLPELPTHAGSN